MKNKKSSKSFADMMKLYSPYKGELFWILFCSCAMSLSNLAYPYLAKYVMNQLMDYGVPDALHYLSEVGIALLILIVIEISTKWVINVNTCVLSDKIKYGLQEKLFAHYQKMSFNYFDNNNVGGMVSVLDGDIDHIDTIIYMLPTTIVDIVISIVGSLLVFSQINKTLLLIVFPLLPLMFLFQIWYKPKMRKKFKHVREARKEQMEFAEDKLSGIRTIISFGKESVENARFHNSADRIIKMSRSKWVGLYIHQMGLSLFEDLFYGLIIIAGGYLAITGKIAITDMAVFYMFSYLIVNPVMQLGSLEKAFQEAIVSYQRVEDCLNTEPEIQNPEEAVYPDSFNGNVQFNDVSFKYNDSSEIVLNHVNLNIESGEYVALVGPSGSGKSTMASLIPRYYDVTSGSITIDDVNIKDMNLQYLRTQVGVVQQDIYLFNGTVYDNIAYGNPDASMKEVRKAAKLANADDFISKLPNGYNSDIGERGVKLSGGQKQRIAIARLFLMNPKILIFDEATSALDNESEKAVQDALEKLAKGKTTIVIAHRLTTIRKAKRILFLTNSGIEEEGSHEELMKKNGKYAKLYKMNQLT